MTQALTTEEADEIRALLDAFPAARRAAQLMTRARLRRTNFAVLAEAPEPSRIGFEQLLADGSVVVDPTISRARITPHSSTQQIFRVAVGVTGRPVDAGWNAFDQRYQWFGKAPKQVTSGAHLFVFAVDRWKSAVVGLYEAVSPGAVKLPGSTRPEPLAVCARCPAARGRPAA